MKKEKPVKFTSMSPSDIKISERIERSTAPKKSIKK